MGRHVIQTIDKYFSLESVAEALGVHRRTVLRLIRAGSLAAVRVGRQYRCSQSGIDDFLRRARAIVQTTVEALEKQADQAWRP